MNSPSSTLSSSPGCFGFGTLDGTNGIGLKRMFSGLMSLWRSVRLSRGTIIHGNSNTPMDDTLFLMQVLEGLGHLDDDMSRQLLAKVCQADDLVEQLATGS